MLSISKLTVGHARYYIDGAGDRVDAAESIGDGVEEYYAGGTGEARGSWFGAGARELGLAGEVGGDELRRVLDGVDREGEALRGGDGRLKVAGYDLALSAPKSVSVLFGLADSELRDVIRGAHDAAVRGAVGHLERTAAAVRRGHGGAVVEPASGLVAGLFRHRTSRAGDPQLHTHVVVANLGRGPDGRWSALDGRRLYAQARTASFVYQAVLRGELTRALGVQWTVAHRGIAEIAGVPRDVQRAFSRRRVEIEAELERHGASGAHASEAAALATRRPKDPAVRAQELQDEWRERAAALGFGARELAAVLGRARQRATPPDWDGLFAALGSPMGLTRTRSTFDRRDVIQALCERLPAASALDVRELEARADEFLASSRVVALLPDQDCYRRRDGRLVPLARETLRYSTPELLAREQLLIERAGSDSAHAVCASPEAVRRAIARRPTLSDEQQRMIAHVCLAPRAVVVVAGKAGAGKTFALAAAREACQQAGHPVLGVAVARRAARELETGAGIQSTSTAALLRDLARGHRLPQGCVLVVDEAAMACTRQLATLLEHVGAAAGKLVLVGDHRQLPAIDAGGAFRALVRRGLAVELTRNQRQTEPWERIALDRLADGRIEQALTSYQDHDRVHIADTAPQTADRLVERWWQEQAAGRDALMLAHRRADVAQLNQLARDHMRQAGRLAGPELELPGGAFAAGDHVLIKRNHHSLGIDNGDRVHVLAVDADNARLAVRIDDRVVELGPQFLHDATERGDPTIAHAYAVTCHVAQGITVDSAFLLADHGLTRELGYTALSRGRAANHLYLTRHPDDPRAEIAPTNQPPQPVDRLIRALTTSDADELALDLDPTALKRDAEHRAEQARRKRLSIEQQRWTPSRKHRLAAAHRRENQAIVDLARARRTAAEHHHGDRPFVTDTEREQRAHERVEQIQQRLERRRELGGHGREL